jgi:TonB-linked SusC/RagA family outer membrane protein
MKKIMEGNRLLRTGINGMSWKIRLLTIVSLLFLLIVPNSGFCQQRKEISGTVEDSKGQPLPGVSLVVKGTTTGTVTDQNGRFRMDIPADTRILVVSFVGMMQQEVNVSGKTSFEIVMDEGTIGIDEVVVTALGITREAKSLGYARQSVNINSMVEARDANLTNMLAGKAAGVNIISAGGSTASTRVVIRGNTSLTGNNQPLYVVDGVIIQNDMGKVEGRTVGAAGASDIDYGNIAANINPDDIESIEILKGANASALYGSDAANGAILITTKKAKKTTDLGISYNLNYMLNTITQFPEFQNIYGGGNSHRLGETNKYRSMAYANMALLSPYNARSWGLPMLGFDVVGRNGVVKTYTPNPDNVVDYFSTSRQIVNNISVSKSNEWGSFRFSYANTNSNDVLEGANKRNRHNFALRSGYNLSKKINLDANIRYSIDKVTDRSYSGWSERNPMMAYLFFPRDLSLSELVPWKDAEGNAIRLSSENVTEYYNPYWALNECWNEDTKNWLLADLTINIEITKALKMRIRGAADIQDSNGFDFTNKGTKGIEDGRYSTFYRNIKNFQYEGFLFYYKKLKKVSLNASVGANWRDNSLYRNTSLTSKLILHDIASLSNSAEAIQTTESLETMRRESIFGSATFGYNEWIYFDVTARNDWNSTLPIEHCSYFYPSASLSFLFSDAFNLQGKILSFGKFRASWAKVGNGTSFNQLYNNFRYGGIYNNIPIFELGSRLKSSALKPETTYSTEIGADLRFFSNRLSTDVTFYTARSVNQIMNPKISPSTGYTEGTYNSGEIRNKGVEISVNATAVKKTDFVWDMTFNWSTNKSEVVSIMDRLSVYTLAEVGSNLRINAEEGKPYGVLRGSRQMRDADGNLMVNASNGRAVVESDAYLGNVNPKFIGSYRSSFIYKNFDFSFMVDFRAGGKFFSRSALHGVREGNWLRSLANRDDYTFSYTVLGEDDLERRGLNKNEPSLAYTDNNRVMGAIFEGILYNFDETSGTYTKIGPNNWYLQPQQYWSHAASYLMDWFIYDASYIKLREISFGYNVPFSIMKKTPLSTAKLSLVGRNLATLYKNTPRGIDPQATNSTGNAQGIEAGFTLPTAYYGFDLKITF